MLKESISGFEKLMDSDESGGSVIIVEGPPGSLKSTFAFTALLNHTKKTDSKALYITLEESRDRHRNNLDKMGLGEFDKITVVDYKYSRKLARVTGTVRGELHWIIDSIKQYNKEHKERFACLVIDSLNALYTLTDTLKDRTEIYFFFEELRKTNATCFIIAEVPEEPHTQINGSILGAERFLSDGLISLGITEVDNRVQRYVQIKKMRGVKHRMDKHSVEIKEGEGVVIVGELIV